MLNTLFKKLLPVAAVGLGLAVSGCDGVNISINDTDGVPLSELHMSGDAPTKIVMAGPDSVVVTEGKTLSIDVEGDDDVVESMRFTLEDGTLGIMREKNSWSGKGTATVRVTMPLPEEVTIAGSGTADIPGLAKDAEITIAGSGKANVAKIDADRLEITIAGSGDLTAAGSAKRLDLTIAGSGNGAMDDLEVGDAEISIAGSGKAAFASDGKVEASVVGSGNVTVYGSADCEISAVGSGKLNCKPAKTDTTTKSKAKKNSK